MKKKNIILISVILALSLIAFFIIRSNSSKKSKVYDFSFREFAVENDENIAKIILYKRSGEIVQLKRNNDNWIVNDKYPASVNAISNLISAIKNVRIDYVPPDAAVENIMKSLMYNGIKVELYDSENKPIKKFYVGDSPDNNIGTYYLMAGSASPLVMSIPGFKGNLRVRFSYTQDEWRDKTVFRIPSGDIDQVSMKYFFDEKNSFFIKKTGNGFTFQNPFDDKSKPARQANIEFSKTYLLGFEDKGCEYIANTIENRDDILSRPPIVEIDIKLRNSKTRKLEIFMLPNLDEEVDDQKEGIDKYLNATVLRYIAKDENGDLFLIQYEVFKDIFVKGEAFLK